MQDIRKKDSQVTQKPAFSILDRPNSYIGKSVPRPNIRRLMCGRGTYTDDIVLPRMVHCAFLRSPHAHARIVSIETDGANELPGVVRIATGPDLARICTPWVGVLDHFPGLKSAPQYPLAIERTCWQGEPVAAVAAETRAQAEDALEHILVEYEELPVVSDMETALAPETPVIHPDLGDNLAFGIELDCGDTKQAFAKADKVIEETFHFARHTGVTLEPRSILADYDPSEGRLTVYQSAQTPYQMQDVYARHFQLPEHLVRVVAKDVGGSFGLKIHVYGDEMTAVGLSILLGRPVKFIADRLESFVSDIHARDHRVTARLAISSDGGILGMEVDDLTGIGPYSVYPRTSAVEGNQVIRLIGAPYAFQDYKAALRVVLQNKNVMCQYRAVGHPIACSVTEAMVDRAAEAAAMDPVEIRRRNYIADDAYPCTSPSGYPFERLSHEQCLDKLLDMMDYAALRREQAALRREGIQRGIGLATFVEITNPGPAFYGVGGARITSQDGCDLMLQPSGKVRCKISVTEQGQGTEAVIAQVVATALGMKLEDVLVITGDTEATPYGGGTWASRGAGIGGETALIAAKALRQNILEVAAVITQGKPDGLDIQDGAVTDLETGQARLGLDEVARIAYFRPDTLPKDFQSDLSVVRHYVPREQPFAFTNGIQASWLEIDTDTGFVRLLKHWVVEDCGTILNPQLVDEQIRGGVVQGLGAALFEECVYNDDGQMLNATMADYLVPMSGEMPDIQVGHVETPTEYSELGAKGAGEAGTAAAAAAVMNAVNDALHPLGAAKIASLPITPKSVLAALNKIS